MDRIRIKGGRKLHGTIPISGAKNATLPLMIASLLTEETLILDNVPRLADVGQLQRILGNHGVDVMVGGKRPGETPYDGQTLHISAARIVDTTAPYDLVSKMRASFWVIAPLVARMGEARVSMPGGCAIGTRPVDLLIMALERLGADIEIDGGYVIARAKHGLKGGEIGDFRLAGRVADQRGPARGRRRHDRDVRSPNRHLGEFDLCSGQTLRRFGHRVARIDLNLGAELLERHQQKVDGPGADRAAARQRNASRAHTRKERRDHPEAGAHFRHHFIRGGRVDDRAGAQMRGLARAGLLADALAVDRIVDAMIAKDIGKLGDVGETRHVFQGQRLIGQ